MPTIKAKYRIVTPMFIGGADQKPSDGIRPPSFKGALRFWWRALNWGRCMAECRGNETHAMTFLYSEECRLFGASAEKGGQGCFLLTIEQPRYHQTINDWPKRDTQSAYLGLGLFSMGKHTQRTALVEKSSFTASFIFRPSTQQNDIKQIKQASIALGLLGGLGSRNRRGFGSIALESIDEQSYLMPSIGDYDESINALLGAIHGSEQLPPYSAWSNACCFIIDKNLKENARSAHSQAGSRYRQHRGRFLGEQKRYFGLPLTKVSEKRRASPLFFHIHPIANAFTCLNLIMPASKFMPDDHTTVRDYKRVYAFVDGGEVL